MVSRSSHSEILKKLETLSTAISGLSEVTGHQSFKSFNISHDQTRSVTFSDSIIFFSQGDTFQDGLKILYDAYYLVYIAAKNGIAMKGSISFGEITVDFQKSLFFGQPIIDAYLLHEDLLMLLIILDNKSEIKLRSLGKNRIFKVLCEYKANLKSGRITHTIVRPLNESLEDQIAALKNLYSTTSGRPRIYIDNTLDFLNTLKLKEE